MKRISWMMIALLCALSAGAATITVGTTATGWPATDLQTISTAQANAGFELKENNAAGLVQSFTATADMTVESISVMAQRLVAGKDFGVDVYEFLPGDGGSTYGANPDKFRLTNASRSLLLKSYSLNASTGITSGNRAANQFNIELDGAEQFDIVAGHAYGIHIYSKVTGGTTARIMLWDYANTDVYAGGTYGVPDANVAPRDLGIALTAVSGYTLAPDADTYVSGNLTPSSNFGTSTELQVRSRNNDGSNRALYSYIRFDLSDYLSISNGASFSLTAAAGSDSWLLGQLQVYGLPETAGLTGQDWSETGLTYNTTGSELASPFVQNVNNFVTNDLVLLGDLPGGSAGDTVTLIGSALESFLSNRVGKAATFIVANSFGSDRFVRFASGNAVSNAPALSFDAEPLPPPEEITLGVEADTYVNAWVTNSSPADIVYGLDTNGWMTVRSRATAPTYRMQVCYIRFDLSSQSSLDNARLILTELDESSAGANPAVVYGLPDVAGLTAQDWNEAALTYNTTGDELIAPFPTNSYALVTNNLVNLGVLPDCSGIEGNQVEFSSAALDAFLRTRLGGTATILLAQTYDRDRQFAFATKECTRPGVEPAKLVFEIPNAVAVDYDSWVAGYSVGTQTNLTDDFDGDGMDNLLEYALGGNPEIDDAAVILPASALDTDNDLLSYIYNRRRDAASVGLSYKVKQDADLLADAWSTNGVTEAGAVITSAGFEKVTATVPTDTDGKFLKLEVEQQ